MNKYKQQIVDWAVHRDIAREECAPKQRLKLIEEVGELASAILKNDKEKIIDSIGDILVVLIILAAQLKQDLDLDSQNPNIFFDRDSYEDSEILSSIIYNDVFVEIEFIRILAARYDLTLEQCLLAAWNEIKDRKGKTVNGTFIKE